MSSFKAWKQNFLQRRDLQIPDGRSLYLYRLQHEEFNDLEQLLRDRLTKYQQLTDMDLGAIAGQAHYFPDLFVLYGAEWWRRRYDGSGWSWEPILRDLNVDPTAWNPSQRSHCVKRGLQGWALKLRETGALRFLGTIALQGGLPMRLLAEAHGQLGRILTQVLRQARSGPVSFRDVVDWVESMGHYLPKTYRQSEIYWLLAEVVWTVLRLKDEARLVQSKEAIAQLDRAVPDWRERFPMPVTDAHAQGLLEQLIRDAASARIVRRALLLPVERLLERTGDGWCLSSSIELPEKLAFSDLSKLFSDENSTARTLKLALDAGDSERSVTLRRLIGHDAYLVTRQPWRLEGEQAADQHFLRLSTPAGQVWTAQSPKGEALAPDLPWVFGPEQDGFRLLRQGGGQVPSIKALVAIPDDWSIDEPAEYQGMLEAPARRLYQIQGLAVIRDGDGQVYRILTGRADAREEHHEWIGKRVQEEFLSPRLAFRGMPTLCILDEEGNRKPGLGQRRWRPIGGQAVIQGEPIGPLSVWYSAGGEEKHRTRMIVLPSSARVEFQPQGEGAGFIRLSGWQAQGARVTTTGVESRCEVQGDDVIVLLSTGDRSRPLEWVEMELRWPSSPVPVRVRLPFPIKGARAFDAHSRALSPGSLIDAHQLTGVRLLALGGDPANMPRMQLVLGLSGNQRPRIYTLTPPEGSARVEIRLLDYASDIQHLLAMDDDPDARVKVDLRIGEEVCNCLCVARYACGMERNGDCIGLDREGLGRINVDTIAALPVMVMRLENPGEEAVQLEARVSEGVATGMWDFAPTTREPGSWLIYPGPDSQLVFRPTLWPIPGEVPTDSPLLKALGIADEAERSVAIDAVIDALAMDFTHPCWLEVERLAGQISHLHLSVLDLWRRVARSPAGMAAMTLRLGNLSNSFVQRFAEELPFAWETISYATWRKAMRNLQQQCITWYGDDFGSTLFTTHLRDRLDELVSQQPALNNLLGIAHARTIGDHPREIALFQSLGIEGIGKLLFKGDDCSLQRLMRMHSESGIGGDQWPSGFSDWIGDYRARHGMLFYPPYMSFRDSVINLPVLLALQAATNTSDEWFDSPQRIHALRIHQNFDPDWFTEAYDWTIARCLTAGLLIEGEEP